MLKKKVFGSCFVEENNFILLFLLQNQTAAIYHHLLLLFANIEEVLLRFKGEQCTIYRFIAVAELTSFKAKDMIYVGSSMLYIFISHITLYIIIHKYVIATSQILEMKNEYYFHLSYGNSYAF